ncbi:S41 family peptidase [Deminuibacter soli]|uniref:Peptidase S41 n=1 Tax=Deminuibacter soli TaxID=2291815 RepID=A0A3E1NQS0_9BACT|nr:S41 family peptidase [Deminuibacter soli]RFM30276.1 peptidase S41 [Deminuibacter soli]
MIKLQQHFIGFVLILLFASCASRKGIAVADRRYAPEQARADVVLLKKILEANHPSLYWYTPKDSIDYYFNAVTAGITDSLTEQQFKNKVSWVVSKIRCGHTAVRNSKAYYRETGKVPRPQFPLIIKTWKDSMVVLANLFKNDTVFTRGTVITGINGLSNKQMLDSMFQLISTDGYSDNFKSQVISMNFPGYYRNSFGISDKYTINYLDSTGKPHTGTIGNYDVKADTAKKSVAVQHLPPLTRRELRRADLSAKRSLRIDTATHTAYMRLTTFSEGRLRRFFARSFRQLHQQQVQNLIIDLRENGGGSIALSNKLTRYLSDHPFVTADTLATPSRRLRYGKYIHPAWVYWISMHFAAHKQADGRYHFIHYEKHAYKPYTKNHFSGQVYVLQGGYTFSAATMFIANIKSQPNVTTTGEETGGGSYGNSSVHLPSVRLPNTGLQVVLPLFRVVINSKQPKTGRGLIPDIAIYPTSNAIERNADIKMEKLQAIIAAHATPQ